MGNKQLLSKGVTTCTGCAMELIARSMVEVLGKRTVVTTPPSCSAILTGFEKSTGWAIPSQQTVLMSIGAYISGISEALKINGEEDSNVVGFAGDGGTFDIGLQAISGAIERNHNFLMVCYNNEAYMNTGNQRSSATTLGAWTKTTPTGKKEASKNIDFMFLHQNLAYQATASVGDIKDLKRKFKRASEIKGPKFIHIQTPCTAGWKFPANQTINVAKKAIDSGMWLLWEREGSKVKVNRKPKDYSLIKEYLASQKRFSNITPEMCEEITKAAKKNYEFIKLMEENEYL
ncbi:thiamine pyrophosphate-dependent enzyme [Maledivibacter halophilus]|uniref:Pyruvate ferredoxin oxidoreductase beta subunit n=1 Tax=Maledivibacter halophilus TaxID=36842 RepID=A0A1T5KGU4_9FIRM|nr:thiamine pyrophosphate-dependent enzyme [Maledivibacter halophilus]SKC62851.1 pyruvate ferredoxin oxidoreductase beta subunit [Maledivibacter halophilus]